MLLATGACANFIVAIAMGDPLELALPLVIANVVEIVICWRILNGVEQFDITRVAHLVRFVLVAGVGAPMAAAVIAGVTFLGRAPFSESFVSWFAADALGLLIFAPALLAIDMRAIGLLAHRRQAIEAALNFVLLTGVCVLVFGQGEYPLLFLVPPTVALTTFRSGINGAALSIIWVSILAITFHLLGTGPAQSVDAGGYTGVYLLQAFLALLSVTTLPLATYLAENQRHQESLRLAHAGTEAARRAALSSEAHYRMLAEHSTDIVVRLVPGGIISYASPACRVLGFSPEQAVGRSTLDFVPPEDRAFAAEVLDGLFTGAEPDRSIRREFRARGADGSIIWLEGNPSIVRDAHGTPVEVVTSYRDVTLRRALEDDLTASRQVAEATAVRAAESELRYRKLADKSLDMIGRVALDATITFASPGCLAILGYQPEELVGTTTLSHTHLLTTSPQLRRCSSNSSPRVPTLSRARISGARNGKMAALSGSKACRTSCSTHSVSHSKFRILRETSQHANNWRMILPQRARRQKPLPKRSLYF
ncbi:MAG: PAS domain S-box protein [Caulobacteraceae bacterium]|nr:PAS domain S-box protein [Caulobacteraceae bacterium]